MQNSLKAIFILRLTHVTYICKQNNYAKSDLNIIGRFNDLAIVLIIHSESEFKIKVDF